MIDLSSLEFGKMQFSIGEHDAVATCRNVTDTVGKVKQTQAELLFVTSLEELIFQQIRSPVYNKDNNNWMAYMHIHILHHGKM